MYSYVILFYYGDDIRNDELRRQVEALRGEVRALSKSFHSLQKEDARNVLGEQIRPVLVEKIELFFSRDLKGRSTAERKRCKGDLIRFVTDAVGIFQRDGRDKAMRFLDEHWAEASSSLTVLNDARCIEFGERIIAQLRSYYELSDQVLEPLVPTVPSPSTTALSKDGQLSPAKAEETLAPLASSKRIDILMHLVAEDESLATLSRTLGLKKGHLQFHLNVLAASGLIIYDRKSHLYAITDKGGRALEGLTRLVADLAVE